MDAIKKNDPPHPTRWAWVGSTAPLGDLSDVVERHIRRTMRHRVDIERHDHTAADDILEWIAVHAAGQGVIALLAGDDGPLTGLFGERADAVLFKLRFG